MEKRNSLLPARKAALERGAYFAAAMAVFLGVFAAAAGMQVDSEDARVFVEEFEEMIEGIDGNGIFVHNAVLAAVMFIPGLGAVWGMISAAATGHAFASILQLNPDLPLAPLEIFLTPFGALELFAYSLAISRSLLLAKILIQRAQQMRHAAYAGAEIGIMAAVLYVAGHIEHGMLEGI